MALCDPRRLRPCHRDRNEQATLCMHGWSPIQDAWKLNVDPLGAVVLANVFHGKGWPGGTCKPRGSLFLSASKSLNLKPEPPLELTSRARSRRGESFLLDQGIPSVVSGHFPQSCDVLDGHHLGSPYLRQIAHDTPCEWLDDGMGRGCPQATSVTGQIIPALLCALIRYYSASLGPSASFVQGA